LKAVRPNIKYSLLMMLAALIWGSAFVAQRVGMDHIGPYTFNCVRSFIGCLALAPVIMTLGRRGATVQLTTGTGRRDLLVGGLFCGAILTVSTLFQQIGLKYTTAGKAGFITAQYIVLVPLFGLALGKRVSWLLWLAVAIALGGMYLLCVKDGFRVEKGDFYVFCCAVCFSCHILVIDHFVQKVDGIMLSCLQFAVCGLLSCILMFIVETPSAGGILKGWVPLLYTGILSSGVAYTLQIITQKHLSAAIAALVMSMESVFAALTGWLVLHENLSAREFIGCVLVFAATLLAQVPAKR
jgi:drug/metabolite transporter (DMT)-like permease